MAASRSTASNNKHSDTSSAPRRISFAKIAEPLEVPKLLDLQTKSFDWLIGNEEWQSDVQQRLDNGEDASLKSGLEEIFEEISPIEDFSGHHVPLLREPGVLRAEEHRGRVQGEGLHLLRTALRLGRVHEQRDR